MEKLNLSQISNLRKPQNPVWKILVFMTPLCLFLMRSPLFLKFKNPGLETLPPVSIYNQYAVHMERPTDPKPKRWKRWIDVVNPTNPTAAYTSLVSEETFNQEIPKNELKSTANFALDPKDVGLIKQSRSSFVEKIKKIKPSGTLAIGSGFGACDGLNGNIVGQLQEVLSAVEHLPASIERGNNLLQFYTHLRDCLLTTMYDQNIDRMVRYRITKLEYVDFNQVPEQQRGNLSGILLKSRNADGSDRLVRANRARFQQIFQNRNPEEWQRRVDLVHTVREHFENQPGIEENITTLQEQIPLLRQNLRSLEHGPKHIVRNFSVESFPAVVQYYSQPHSGVQLAVSMDLKKYEFSFGVGKSIFRGLGSKKYGIVSGVDVGLRFKRSTNSSNYGRLGFNYFLGVGYRF